MLLFPPIASSEMNNVASLREHEHAAQYRMYFFGQFRAFYKNGLLAETGWRRNKAKLLLKWFVLNSGKLFSADQLIELFWPHVEGESASRNLYVTIHYLRHLLEPNLSPRQESSFIRRNANNCYWFDPNDNWWVDIHSLHHLLELARDYDKQGAHSKATQLYRKIVNYCGQGFLPEDIYEEAFRSYRHQCESLFSQTLLRLITIYLQQNDLDEVFEYSYQALMVDPYCEQAMRAIVNAHVRQGNSRAALKKLEEFQTFLQKELGMGPSKEFRQLQAEIAQAF